jgi:hypothetical protein
VVWRSREHETGSPFLSKTKENFTEGNEANEGMEEQAEFTYFETFGLKNLSLRPCELVSAIVLPQHGAC